MVSEKLHGVSVCLLLQWDSEVCFAAISFLLLGLPVCVLDRDSVLGAPGRCRGWVHATGGALEAWPQRPLPCPVQLTQAFVVKQGIHVSGTSPESISSLLSEVAECGTHYARLSHFSLQPVLDSSCSEGLVFQVGPTSSGPNPGPCGPRFPRNL